MRYRSFLLLFFLMPGLLISCSRLPLDNPDANIIYVSILPQKYFADRICGDKFEVKVMVQPGKSPATYEPLPAQITELSMAKIFFTIGVPFENSFLPKIKSALPDLKTVDASCGIVKRTLTDHDHHDHHEDHGIHEKNKSEDLKITGDSCNTIKSELKKHDDEHDQALTSDHGKSPEDPHVWMSPRLAAVAAQTMLDEIIKIDPDNKDYYKHNFSLLEEDLDSLHKELTERLKSLEGRTMLVFHPSFGYFADEYKLKQVAIEAGAKKVEPAGLVRIIEFAKKEKISMLFVQPEFSQRSARAVADAVGAKVVVTSPLDYDYINNMRKIANQLREIK